MIINILPKSGEVVSQRNEMQKRFFSLYGEYSGKYRRDCSYQVWTSLKGDDAFTYPVPVLFIIRDDRTEFAEDCRKKHILHVSEYEDFKDEMTYEENEHDGFCVYNFKIGKRYYWYAENEEGERSEVTFFDTADEYPRFIYLSGRNCNIRDIGGCINIDGKRVKQGLIYRGAAIDKLNAFGDEGAHRFLDEMKIKTDIDLRVDDYIDQDILPPRNERVEKETVIHRIYAGGYIDCFTNPMFVYEMTRVLKLLADSTIYPAYLHCYAGFDRTGTYSYLLGLILRIDTEQLYLDYETSALDGWYGNTCGHFINDINPLITESGDPGDDIYTCVDKYIEKTLDLPGVPEKIRKILLEE